MNRISVEEGEKIIIKFPTKSNWLEIEHNGWNECIKYSSSSSSYSRLVFVLYLFFSFVPLLLPYCSMSGFGELNTNSLLSSFAVLCFFSRSLSVRFRHTKRKHQRPESKYFHHHGALLLVRWCHCALLL